MVGGLAFIYVKTWSYWLSTYSAPFAAGILLTVTFMGILPEAVHLAGEEVLTTVFLTFLVAFLFENLFFGIHHHNSEGHQGHTRKGPTFLVIVGDTIHNTIDGIAIAAAYLTSPGLGLVTALSSFLHEVPHEIGDFGILMKAGWNRNKIILVNLASAAFTVFGAYLIFTLPVSDFFIGQALALAAGIFIYLGASDFLPEISDSGPRHIYGLVSLLLGVIVMMTVLMAVPHVHEELDDHGKTSGIIDQLEVITPL